MEGEADPRRSQYVLHELGAAVHEQHEGASGVLHLCVTFGSPFRPSLTFSLFPASAGVYKNELNPENPLGMNGQVAEAFGTLIERLWSSSGGVVAPREFKQALSKFAPSFSGYGQQDSQELLAFLLDGTHEDLNRIKVKPVTNAPDWEGGDDKDMVELAKTCWEQYRSRNDSVIVDLFQGQYRSTVVCPDCDKVRSFTAIMVGSS